MGCEINDYVVRRKVRLLIGLEGGGGVEKNVFASGLSGFSCIIVKYSRLAS